MGNRPISQPENARRMQDRSAVEGHTGFAIVAIAIERHTWFTSPQKWCSAGTNGTPPLTHILVSALGAGFWTGNAFTVFKLLVQKIQAFIFLCKNSQLPNRKNWQKIWAKDEFSFGSVLDQFWSWHQILKMNYWKHAVSSPKASLPPWPDSCRHWLGSGCSQSSAPAADLTERQFQC